MSPHNLAGGGALIAHGLVDRPTDDLDAFTRATGEDFADVANKVRAAFEAANYMVTPDPQSHPSYDVRTWLIQETRTSGRGRRPEIVKIQIYRDSVTRAAASSRLGPLVDAQELGANKVVTIYHRSRHRDFDDVARIAPRLGVADMIAMADTKMVTPIDRPTLASCFRAIRHLDDDRFPDPGKANDLRVYFHALADRLAGGVDLIFPSPYEQIWTPVPPSKAALDDRWKKLQTDLEERAGRRRATDDGAL